jgi:periplasmic protein TonB
MRTILLLLLSSSLACVAQTQPASTPIPMRDVIKAVKPDYPQEARRRHIMGSGIVVLNVDRASGRVTSVTMAQSTGHKILDDAAIHTFSQWRFKPGVVTIGRVKIPISYKTW